MNNSEKIEVVNTFYSSLIEENDKNINESFYYSYDLKPHSFYPNWEKWKFKPSTNSYGLAQLSLGLEQGSSLAIDQMLEGINKYKDVINSLNYTTYEMIDIARIGKELLKGIEDRSSIIGNHIDEKLLKTSRIEGGIYGTTSYILFSDFVDWLKKIGLDYDANLDNCYREENHIDAYKELKDTKRVLAMVLDIIKAKNITQDLLSSTIDEDTKYKNKGFSKRSVNDIFAKSRKELNN